MGLPNNKKYTNDVILNFMKDSYPNLEVLSIEEPCESNRHKPRVKFTNGYEIKFAYFDNIRRGKFNFSEYTPNYIKKLLEENFNVKVHTMTPLDNKCNSFTIFEITTFEGKTIKASGNYISSCIKNKVDIFHDTRKEAWTEQDVIEFLSDEKYGLSDIRLEYDTKKPFNCRSCKIYFTYDKVEMDCCFRSIRDALIKGGSAYLNLNRGEKFYKNMLKEKFGIENVGFTRLYKVTTRSGKKTYMADIYNIDDGTEVKGVLTDNLKKRGYYFRGFQGEIIIENLLKEFGVEYETQKCFSECKHRQPLRFDFYIPKYNLCIEYDGEFHYQSFEFAGGDKGLKSQQKRDAIKNNFCEKENIKLVRIPYFEKENIPNIIQDIVSSN